MTHLGRWISALVDGELDGAERDHVLSHLARCESCLSEANALRALKKRMGGLGDTAADSTMTNRLIGLAGPDQRRAQRSLRAGRGGRGGRWRLAVLRLRRRRHDDLGPLRPASRPAWMLLAGAAGAGLAGIGAAAFLLGGGAPSPAPRITPAVDAYWTQHGFDTGQAPARPGAPSTVPAGTGSVAGSGSGSRSSP